MAETSNRVCVVPQLEGHDHTHTVILLHGRDSTAIDFSDEFFESQASDDRTLPQIYPSVKWVFPSARTLNCERFGVEMSQWFDMWSTENPEQREDLSIPDLKESVSFLAELIQQESDVLGDCGRIILGGISQGCATAIHTLFHLNIGKLGGFIGLCSWLPLQNDIDRILSDSNHPEETIRNVRKLLDIKSEATGDSTTALQTPVFLSHSLGDPVIDVRHGESLSKNLINMGMHVEWRTYDNEEHWITEPQGVDDIVAFLNKNLKAPNTKLSITI